MSPSNWISQCSRPAQTVFSLRPERMNICRGLTRFALVACCLGAALCLPAESWAQTSNPDAVHDIVSSAFAAQQMCHDAKNGITTGIESDLTNLDNGKNLDWESGPLRGIIAAALAQYPIPPSSYYLAADGETAYIFHVSHWTKTSDKQGTHYSPVSSNWYVYVRNRRGNLRQSGFRGNGDPLIYGKKRAVIFGIDVINADAPDFQASYKTTATQGTPENLQDLGQLINALTGISAQGKGVPVEGAQKPPPPICNLYIAAGVQEGTKRLPFDANVAVTTGDPTAAQKDGGGVPHDPPTGGSPDGGKQMDETLGANPQAGVAGTQPPKGNKQSANGKQDGSGQSASPGVLSCTGSNGNTTPCTTTRTFTSLDREWWDVSIGVTTPGVKESQYSIVNSMLSSSTTRHTDLYGMFDIYWSAAWWTKESACPHIALGVPVTNKSLYRPFFGLSENLTGWSHAQKALGLPVGINFFAGVVYMKIAAVSDEPTTAAALMMDTHHPRIWKGVFGIEVPISSMASKIGKGGSSKNSNGNGKSAQGSSP